MKTDGCDSDRAIWRDTRFSGLAYFLPSLTDLTAAFIFLEEAKAASRTVWPQRQFSHGTRRREVSLQPWLCGKYLAFAFLILESFGLVQEAPQLHSALQLASESV